MRAPSSRTRQALSGPNLARWNLAYVLLLTIVGSHGLDATVTGFAATLAVQQWLAVTLAAGLVVLNSPSIVPQLPALARTLACRRAVPLLLLALFYVFLFASLAWTEHPHVGVRKGGALAVTTLAAVVLATQVDAVRVFRTYVLGVGVVLGASALLLIAGHEGATMYGPGHPEAGELYSGVFSNRNFLAKLSALGLAVAIALAVARCLGPWVALAIAVAVVVTVALAGSRGAWLMVVLTPLIVWCGRDRRVLGATLLAAVGGLIAVAAGFAAGWLAVDGQILLFGGEPLFHDPRVALWQFGLQQFTERPLFGYGLTGFWSTERHEQFMAASGLPYSSLHSGFVRLLVVGGLVGAGLFLAALVALHAVVHRRLRFGVEPEVAVCVAYVLAYLVCNLHEYYMLRGTQFGQTLFTYALVRLAWLHATQPEASTA